MAARAGELRADPGDREYCECTLMVDSLDLNFDDGMGMGSLVDTVSVDSHNVSSTGSK